MKKYSVTVFLGFIVGLGFLAGSAQAKLPSHEDELLRGAEQIRDQIKKYTTENEATNDVKELSYFDRQALLSLDNGIKESSEHFVKAQNKLVQYYTMLEEKKIIEANIPVLVQQVEQHRAKKYLKAACDSEDIHYGPSTDCRERQMSIQEYLVNFSVQLRIYPCDDQSTTKRTTDFHQEFCNYLHTDSGNTLYRLYEQQQILSNITERLKVEEKSFEQYSSTIESESEKIYSYLGAAYKILEKYMSKTDESQALLLFLDPNLSDTLKRLRDGEFLPLKKTKKGNAHESFPVSVFGDDGRTEVKKSPDSVAPSGPNSSDSTSGE